MVDNENTIRKENGYWVDKNNNKWDKKGYTKDQAKKHSSTLINCSDCTNCEYCSDCEYCMNCSDCRYCGYCTNCEYCRYCGYCTNCSDCGHCSDCRNCRNCSDCRDCKDCRDCVGFLSTPQRYSTAKIGSRHDNTQFYYGDTKNGKLLRVVCGCFSGHLENFERAVLETHENNKVYKEQYLKEIEKVRILFELKEV